MSVGSLGGPEVPGNLMILNEVDLNLNELYTTFGDEDLCASLQHLAIFFATAPHGLLGAPVEQQK